ncbi:RNA pyrophosphohydrolase [Salinarimonas soli]|uniref:RNA pyrophosphohydrolase n=1 Tax=Salinarimonas soli TaxID=1638099 RepID=A0A5B2VQP9_9HYPH|nr:RNA pyrophosphohydrolase [Salinarimonas soli]KAA2241094.1 RNA pyrophosphohydrolase [Salinarimonas soli]
MRISPPFCRASSGRGCAEAVTKPYRANVGICVFNAHGRVLIARRIASDGPEIILPGFEWQMPQGGIDPDEDPKVAAHRELREETGITHVTPLAALDEWLSYDFPSYTGPPHRLDRFRGQRQRWFAMRHDGPDADIDVTRATPEAPQEFDAWRWESLERVPDLVVPFRRPIYERVVQAFMRFARRM